MQNGLMIQGYQNHRLDSGFLTTQKDRQEADLKKFYLPAGHADFGLDLPSDYGILTYYDEEQTLTQMKIWEEVTKACNNGGAI